MMGKMKTDETENRWEVMGGCFVEGWAAKHVGGHWGVWFVALFSCRLEKHKKKREND